MSRSTSPLLRDDRAVSEIVGEILLIGIVVAAITVGARVYLGRQPAFSRFALFSVQVENTDESCKVRVTIKHVGGEPIVDPKYLTVWGAVDRSGVEENMAYEDDDPAENLFGFSWYQSNYGKFDLGDTATLFIRRCGVPEDRYRVVPGDRYRVKIYDNYSEKIIYEKVLTVVASL
jgi:flagellin-like protein